MVSSSENTGKFFTSPHTINMGQSVSKETTAPLAVSIRDIVSLSATLSANTYIRPARS